eukprot:1185046-Prorocentrum_minimum.AAC.5
MPLLAEGNPPTNWTSHYTVRDDECFDRAFECLALFKATTSKCVVRIPLHRDFLCKYTFQLSSKFCVCCDKSGTMPISNLTTCLDLLGGSGIVLSLEQKVGSA